MKKNHRVIGKGVESMAKNLGWLNAIGELGGV